MHTHTRASLAAVCRWWTVVVSWLTGRRQHLSARRRRNPEVSLQTGDPQQQQQPPQSTVPLSTGNRLLCCLVVDMLVPVEERGSVYSLTVQFGLCLTSVTPDSVHNLLVLRCCFFKDTLFLSRHRVLSVNTTYEKSISQHLSLINN